MNYKHILFDADNTLFDFTASSHLAFADTLTHYGLVPSDDHYKTYSPINSDAWKQLERKAIDMDGVRRLRWEKFWAALNLNHDPFETNRIYLERLVDHCFLLNDTIEVLEHLQTLSSVEMHIITNGMKEAQRPRISKLDLNKYFKTIVVSDEIGFAKPDGRFFDITFQSLIGVEKSQCLVVGDSLHSDIQGGNNYGINTCWFNPESKSNETDIKPTYEIRSLLELKTLIK